MKGSAVALSEETGYSPDLAAPVAEDAGLVSVCPSSLLLSIGYLNSGQPQVSSPIKLPI